MTFWSDTMRGVVVGGVLTSATQFGTQLLGNWREGKRADRTAKAQARAEREALQVRTLADLQEQIEAVSVMVGAEASKPVKAALFSNPFTANNFEIPDLTPYNRTVMLCSRLQDQALAVDVRAWLRDLRTALSASPLTSADLLPLRDRRVDLQDRIGAQLLGYYGQD